jgi:hypothetical protein
MVGSWLIKEFAYQPTKQRQRLEQKLGLLEPKPKQCYLLNPNELMTYDELNQRQQ